MHPEYKMRSTLAMVAVTALLLMSSLPISVDTDANGIEDGLGVSFESNIMTGEEIKILKGDGIIDEYISYVLSDMGLNIYSGGLPILDVGEKSVSDAFMQNWFTYKYASTVTNRYYSVISMTVSFIATVNQHGEGAPILNPSFQGDCTEKLTEFLGTDTFSSGDRIECVCDIHISEYGKYNNLYATLSNGDYISSSYSGDYSFSDVFTLKSMKIVTPTSEKEFSGRIDYQAFGVTISNKYFEEEPEIGSKYLVEINNRYSKYSDDVVLTLDGKEYFMGYSNPNVTLYEYELTLSDDDVIPKESFNNTSNISKMFFKNYDIDVLGFLKDHGTVKEEYLSTYWEISDRYEIEFSGIGSREDSVTFIMMLFWINSMVFVAIIVILVVFMQKRKEKYLKSLDTDD